MRAANEMESFTLPVQTQITQHQALINTSAMGSDDSLHNCKKKLE
jgi:hypothetical protein